jgi:hypothetical protein
MRPTVPVLCPFFRGHCVEHPVLYSTSAGSLFRFIRVTCTPPVVGGVGFVLMVLMVFYCVYMQFGLIGLLLLRSPDIERFEYCGILSHPDLFQSDLSTVERILRDQADEKGMVTYQALLDAKKVVAERSGIDEEGFASQVETRLLFILSGGRELVAVDQVMATLLPTNQHSIPLITGGQFFRSLFARYHVGSMSSMQVVRYILLDRPSFPNLWQLLYNPHWLFGNQGWQQLM